MATTVVRCSASGSVPSGTAHFCHSVSHVGHFRTNNNVNTENHDFKKNNENKNTIKIILGW